MSLALTILLTGLVMVFAVLILLILLIKSYSTIIYKVQNKNPKQNTSTTYKKETPENIPQETIVAISAAISLTYLNSNNQFKIKSVKRRRQHRSLWSLAGLLDETSPF